MSKIQDLLAKKAEAWNAMQEIKSQLEKGESLADGDGLLRKKFEATSKAFEQAEEDIRAYESISKIGDLTAESLVEKELEKKNLTKEQKRIPTEGEAFLKLVKNNMDRSALTSEERGIVDKLKTRAQSTTDGAGGYTIPEEWAPDVYAVMLAYGPFAAEGNGSLGSQNGIGRVFSTAGGGTMHFPVTNDTANSGRMLSEGSSAASGATDLVYTEVTLDAHTATSDLIQVSNQLLQDNGVNFPAHLAEMLGIRLGRIYNSELTNGVGGTSNARGIADAATLYDATAETGAITQAEIRGLKFSVDHAYHRGPQSGFMLHQSTLSYIMGLDLSSNQTQPLFQPDFAAGAPGTLLGSPYWINNDLGELSDAGADLILFGDFSKFYIRRAGGVVVRQLNERYAELNQTAWVGFMRFDSDLIDATAVKRLKEDAT